MRTTKAEIQHDIDRVQTMLTADPDLRDIPSDFGLSDAMVSRMKHKAEHALGNVLPSLVGEGHGATHEIYRLYAEQFAVTVFLLLADRDNRLHNAPSGVATRREGEIIEEMAETIRVDSTYFLREELNALDDLPRIGSYEHMVSATQYFGTATIRLALDREGAQVSALDVAAE